MPQVRQPARPSPVHRKRRVQSPEATGPPVSAPAAAWTSLRSLPPHLLTLMHAAAFHAPRLAAAARMQGRVLGTWAGVLRDIRMTLAHACCAVVAAWRAWNRVRQCKPLLPPAHHIGFISWPVERRGQCAKQPTALLSGRVVGTEPAGSQPRRAPGAGGGRVCMYVWRAGCCSVPQC